MRSIQSFVGGALAVLALAGCSVDSVTAPTAPERTAPKANSSGGIAVFFIQQPGDFGIGQSCFWEASASGGDTGSHTYTWSPGGSWSSPNGALTENWSFSNYWSGTANSTGWYWLTVTVTDAYGNYGSATSSGAVNLYYNRFCD